MEQQGLDIAQVGWRDGLMEGPLLGCTYVPALRFSTYSPALLNIALLLLQGIGSGVSVSFLSCLPGCKD